jgi:hypothetical protein
VGRSLAGRERVVLPPPENSTNINTHCCNLGLSDRQEIDLAAFLETLTDGYVPERPVQAFSPLDPDHCDRRQ